jgi:hypothetical protein
MALHLLLEPVEQGERVAGRAGEAGEHVTLAEAPDLPRLGLDHDLAHRHLAVGAEGRDAPVDPAQDGGRAEARAVGDIEGTGHGGHPFAGLGETRARPAQARGCAFS